LKGSRKVLHEEKPKERRKEPLHLRNEREALEGVAERVLTGFIL